MYNKYLGTPYKFNGTSISEGLDCNTAASLIARETANIFIPIVNHTYKTIKNFQHLFSDEIISGRWEEVERQKNVVVVFKIGKEISHMGWMVDDKNFIHIMEGTEVSIENIEDIMWAKRVAGYYIYKAEYENS